MVFGLSACGVADKAPPILRYHMHGVIVNLDPAGKTANIKHDKIDGYMDAMTMDYPIRDAREFSNLHAGETIDATVFVQDTDFWVGEIRESK